MKKNKEPIEYLDFQTDVERRIFADAIASIPKTVEVKTAIAKNKVKNRGFKLNVNIESLKKCGLDSNVTLHFKKVRNKDNTYDLDFTFYKI